MSIVSSYQTQGGLTFITKISSVEYRRCRFSKDLKSKRSFSHITWNGVQWLDMVVWNVPDSLALENSTLPLSPRTGSKSTTFLPLHAMISSRTSTKIRMSIACSLVTMYCNFIFILIDLRTLWGFLVENGDVQYYRRWWLSSKQRMGVEEGFL